MNRRNIDLRKRRTEARSCVRAVHALLRGIVSVGHFKMTNTTT